MKTRTRIKHQQDDLNTLLRELTAELTECTRLAENNDTQFMRRTLFRTAFSTLEAVNSLIADKAIQAQMARLYECRHSLNITNLLLLTGREYKIAENGDVRSPRARHPFLNYSAFVLKTFAECAGVSKPSLGNSGWRDLRASVAVRNRITHPKPKTIWQSLMQSWAHWCELHTGTCSRFTRSGNGQRSFLSPRLNNSSSMAELRAYFTNCPISGDERTKHATDWREDTIRLQHRGLEFRIVQRFDHLGYNRRYDNVNVHTTDVYVTDVTSRKLKRVQRMLRELAWLLSFATYSDVAYAGYEFNHGTTLGSRWSTTGRLRHYRPTFETSDGSAIKKFLEAAWPSFGKLNRIRKLGIVIHYILLADRHEQPVEVQLLLVFVALESLKTTYATSKHIPFIGGQFRKISSPPKSNPRKEPPYSFEDLLKLMLRDVKMGRTGLKQPIKLRNRIVHNGIATARGSTLHRLYDSVQDILREYMLRLLNYEGEFFLYASPGVKPKKIK
jgi:hypothetical protein